MAVSAATLQSWLDELNEAIASGARAVSFSSPNGTSRSVTYGSYAEMLRARADLQRQLGTAPTRIRTGVSRFGRGL